MIYRYFISISFNGSGYNGWQIQKNSEDTIQQKIEVALGRILNEKIRVNGCCRTDTGVHATGLIAHFDSKEGNLGGKNENTWLRKFNALLPEDIAITSIRAVRPESNARFDALSRTYEYRLHAKRDPFLLGRSALFHGDLDMKSMNRAAAFLKKYNDFTSFCKVNDQRHDNKCTVFSAAWKSTGDREWIFTIKANRFLRGMVRIVVGNLLQVGRGRISVNEFKNILEKKDSRLAAGAAHACGLYLVKAEYPKKIYS